jgi:tetratricopeptide (TPR) repeat protein
MACCYEKIGKFENSIRWFKHVLEINPNNSDAYYGLALANFKVKRYFEAHKCVEKAIEFY